MMLVPVVASLAACASPVYLHSDTLATSTAKAAGALPDDAAALKPFDDQLAILAAFADKENLAVAGYWTTLRDFHFAGIIALGNRQRGQLLVPEINNRLDLLLGPGRRRVPADRTGPANEKAEIQSLADARRREYRRAAPVGDDTDLSCDSVEARVSQAESNRLSLSRDAREQALGVLAMACRRLDDKKRAMTEIEAAYGQIEAAGGELGIEARKAAISEDNIEPHLGPHAAALQEQIDNADKWSKTDSSVHRLQEFRDNVERILSSTADLPVNQATKLAGLEQVSTLIDGLLVAKVCDGKDEAAKTKAGCADLKATSTAGRAQAVWAFAKALALLADANAAQRRSSGWLLAAKAIIAAERADAALVLEQAKALAQAHRQRADALRREASFLAAARDFTAGPRPECHSAPGADPGPNLHCALAAYLDSWNQGRIAAGVLAYRPVQIERSFAVRRARAVAQKQHALASAGTATLKEYGAGGLTAAEIAQALFDVAILTGSGV
jgi:hypothetical protein